MKIKQRDFVPEPKEIKLSEKALSRIMYYKLINYAVEMYMRGKYGDNVKYEISEYDPDINSIAEVIIYDEKAA